MQEITMEQFYALAESCECLTRQEEIECAQKMKDGDLDEKAKMIASYIPMMAGHIKHMKPQFQTIELVSDCMKALEKAVDSYDFIQESETFTHRLSWWLRETSTRYIAVKCRAEQAAFACQDMEKEL